MTHSLSKIALALALTLATATAGCPDPTDDKPKAEVKDVAVKDVGAKDGKAEPVAAAKPAAGGRSFSEQGSTLLFVGSKVTGSHDGGFKKFSGTVAGEGDEVSAVALTIDMASVFSDAAKLTGHLKSPDFFDVAKYAQATFKSTAVKKAAAGGKHTHDVTGTLALHGATKQITFPISVAKKGAHITGEFSINRKDFGIIYPGKAEDLIRDNVLVKLDLAVK